MAPGRYEPKGLMDAMDSLLPADKRTGDLETDLIAAFNECLRRRAENARDGGAIVAAMRQSVTQGGLGWSWRTFTLKTGQSPRTGGRWLDQVVEGKTGGTS